MSPAPTMTRAECVRQLARAWRKLRECAPELNQQGVNLCLDVIRAREKDLQRMDGEGA